MFILAFSMMIKRKITASQINIELNKKTSFILKKKRIKCADVCDVGDNCTMHNH